MTTDEKFVLKLKGGGTQELTTDELFAELLAAANMCKCGGAHEFTATQRALLKVKPKQGMITFSAADTIRKLLKSKIN